ncbi:MAG: hypothetical protein DHS20C16_26650 [Phycisphaerae bacterium]|nr:MAG: hypothetical protein DHS20C16_26650 [Phycisphaerae bacterium]
MLSAGLGLVAGSGCVSRVDALTRQLESKNPANRIRAVHSIGEDQVTELLPALVNRLDDVDAAVRLYTIVALEKLTGERLGFNYAAGSHQRQEAVSNWRRYIEERANGSGKNGSGKNGSGNSVEGSAEGSDAPPEDPSESQSAG